ncbi:pitrilysin family protein [Methylobacterium sp. Leaf123]|uniref:M16 family metallopeptidase n=1 Tax=Methylobacterium sp. Leaf123 TaxID=1736264 RepID=UPI0009E68EDC|nr:pitrilysin family protein [Methylobacterium sp. Leaf123]
MTIHVAPPATAIADRVLHPRSPGGIEAWLIEDHTLPILSAQFGFRGGPVLDPADRAGTAQMLADLLSEGAGPLEGGAFRRALGDQAIRLSFSIWSDSLRGELKTLSRNVERAFELLGLAVQAPLLAPDDMARIRGAMASEVRAGLGRPDVTVGRAFAARGFSGHPYARPASGDLASLECIERADLVALQARMLARGNLRVAVVGAIGPEALCAVLDRAFAALPAEAVEPTPATTLGGLGQRVVTRLGLPQSTIRFGRPGIARTDPDFAAAMVVNQCLGGGDLSSRLFREVREKRGLCYSVRSMLQVADGACTFVGTTATSNDRAAEALGVIEDEIRRLSREGLAAEEVDRAKGYLLGSYKLRLDTSSALAAVLLGLQLDGREPSWLDERNRQIAVVTPADAARAAERLLGDGQLLVAAAGDPAGLLGEDRAIGPNAHTARLGTDSGANETTGRGGI